MARRLDQPGGGDVVRYESKLDNTPGVAYAWPNARALNASQQLTSQDSLIAVGMAANRVITLPSLGSMQNGQAIQIASNPGVGMLTIAAHAVDAKLLAPRPIEYLFNFFTVPVAKSLTIRRVDDPATGDAYWRIDNGTIVGPGPGGTLLETAVGYQMVEFNDQGTPLVFANPGDVAPWTTGIPVFADPLGLFSNPAGSQIQVEEAAQGMFKIAAYVSFKTTIPNNLLTTFVTANGGAWPYPGQLVAVDEIEMSVEEGAVENLAMDAVVPVLDPPWPAVLELNFSLRLADTLTLYAVGMSIYRG